MAELGAVAAAIVCAFSCRRVLTFAPRASVLDRSGPTTGSSGPHRRLVDPVSLLVAVAAWVTTSDVFATFAATLVAHLGLPLVRRRIAARREETRFRAALPAFVEEVARCLRGGLAPSQALIDAASLAPAPFPAVFAPAATLLHAGATSTEAVGSWAVSRDDASLRFFATAVAVGDAVGGIDGRAADAVATALRERATTEAVVRLQATQALYSAGILCVAPVAFCFLIVLGDARASAFLLHTVPGAMVGVAGVGLDIAGALWMRRLVRKISS